MLRDVKGTSVSYASNRVKFSPIARLRDINKEKYKNLGDEIIDFSNGDVGFPMNSLAQEAIKNSISNPKYHKYPPTKGDPGLIERLVVKLRERNNIEIDADCIQITAGGMQAIYASFASLLNQGDRVIIPRPYWSPVKDDVYSFLGICDFYDLEKDYIFDIKKLESLVKPNKTKIIYLNTPHNPTGSTIERKTLEDIAEMALKHNLFVISDEAYESITYDSADHTSIASLDKKLLQNSASIFSFSKTYNMTGSRVGYVVTTNKRFFEALRKHCLNTTNGVTWYAQRGALAALEDKETPKKELEEYKKRRDTLVPLLKDLGFGVVMPRGTYYCFADTSNISLATVKGKSGGMAAHDFLLNNCGVDTCPGEFFGANWSHYLRFGFSIESEERIKEAFGRMKEKL